MNYSLQKPCSAAIWVMILIALIASQALAVDDGTIRFSCSAKPGSIAHRAMNNLYTRAFSRIGLEFELVNVPPLRMASQVERGMVDGACGEDREYFESMGASSRIEVVEVVMGIGEIQAWSVQPQLKLSSWDSLKSNGLKYGCMQGAPISMMYLTKNDLGACIQYSNFHNGLKMLNSGRLDVMVGLNLGILEAKLALGDSDQSYLAGVLTTVKYHSILHSSSRNIKLQLEQSLQQVLDTHYGPISSDNIMLWATLPVADL